jgi:hypothetical protein
MLWAKGTKKASKGMGRLQETGHPINFRYSEFILSVVHRTKTRDAWNFCAPNIPTHSHTKFSTLDCTGPVLHTERFGVNQTRGKPSLSPSLFLTLPSQTNVFQKHQIFSSINNCNRMP